MAASERLSLCLVALLGGCSLITSASDHQDGVAMDAGPDAALADAGDGDLGAPEDSGTEDLGAEEDMFSPPDMGMDCGGVAELSGGSLVAEGRSAYDLDDLTLEVWFRPEEQALDGDRNVFGRWGVLDVTGSYALYLANGRPALGISCNGSDFTQAEAAVEDALMVGVWVHLAATFDASTGTATVYVDGRRVANRAIGCGGDGPHEATNEDLVLGYDDPDGGDPAQGLVDEARLSRSVRYTGPFTPELNLEADANTVAYYRFEDTMLPATDDSDADPPNSMSAVGLAGLIEACRP